MISPSKSPKRKTSDGSQTPKLSAVLSPGPVLQQVNDSLSQSSHGPASPTRASSSISPPSRSASPTKRLRLTRPAAVSNNNYDKNSLETPNLAYQTQQSAGPELSTPELPVRCASVPPNLLTPPPRSTFLEEINAEMAHSSPGSPTSPGSPLSPISPAQRNLSGNTYPHICVHDPLGENAVSRGPCRHLYASLFPESPENEEEHSKKQQQNLLEQKKQEVPKKHNVLYSHRDLTTSTLMTRSIHQTSRLAPFTERCHRKPQVLSPATSPEVSISTPEISSGEEHLSGSATSQSTSLSSDLTPLASATTVTTEDDDHNSNNNNALPQESFLSKERHNRELIANFNDQSKVEIALSSFDIFVDDPADAEIKKSGRVTGMVPRRPFDELPIDEFPGYITVRGSTLGNEDAKNPLRDENVTLRLAGDWPATPTTTSSPRPKTQAKTIGPGSFRSVSVPVYATPPRSRFGYKGDLDFAIFEDGDNKPAQQNLQLDKTLRGSRAASTNNENSDDGGDDYKENNVF